MARRARTVLPRAQPDPSRRESVRRVSACVYRRIRNCECSSRSWAVRISWSDAFQHILKLVRSPSNFSGSIWPPRRWGIRTIEYFETMKSKPTTTAKTLEKRLSHPKYRPDIDGLRAIAVIAVVLFHAFPRKIGGGFVGVDIFFVISGFLISSIIIGNLERGSFKFGEFYSRRINRIFPALLLVLFASWASGWFILFEDEYISLGKHVAGGAAFISNFVLLQESGYFDSSADFKILLHLWSLGIEEQFYLIWPIILWAAWKCKLNTLLVIIIAASLSFWMNIKNISIDVSSTFYSPQTRFWELLVGAFLAYVLSHKETLFPNWPSASNRVIRNAQSVVGVSFLVTAFSITRSTDAFPGWWALLPTIGTALVIAAGPFAWINRVVLSSRLVVWFGLISFPLYLWHWPLLTYARIIDGGIPPTKVRVWLVILAVLLAWLTYRFVERPFRTGPRSMVKTTVLSGLMIVIAAAGYASYQKYISLSERGMTKLSEEVSAQFVGWNWQYMKNDSCLKKYATPETKDYSWWFCMENNNAKPTLMLIGTSFANHLFPGLAHNQKTQHYSILNIGACDPGLPETSPTGTIPVIHPCSGERPLHQKKQIKSIIESAGSVRYAIIAGLEKKPDLEYTQRLNDYLSMLEKNNVIPILFTPHVEPKKDTKSCFTRPFKKHPESCIISAKERDEITKDFKIVIEQVTKAHPDVKFFDPNDVICNSQTCSFIKNGMPMFRDEVHFSEYGSEIVIQRFVEWAELNAPGILAR